MVPYIIYIHHKQFIPCLVLAIDVSFLLPRMSVEISACINMLYVVSSVAITEIIGYYLWQAFVIYRRFIFGIT